MKKKYIFALISIVLLLISCERRPLQDGTYEGISTKDERGAYGEISVTIHDNKITACTYRTRQKDGTIKDENYGKLSGKTNNEEFYKKAQTAVAAMSVYAKELVNTGAPELVDSITGASLSYGQFQEAANDALQKSRRKK